MFCRAIYLHFSLKEYIILFHSFSAAAVSQPIYFFVSSFFLQFLSPIFDDKMAKPEILCGELPTDIEVVMK